MALAMVNEWRWPGVRCLGMTKVASSTGQLLNDHSHFFRFFPGNFNDDGPWPLLSPIKSRILENFRFSLQPTLNMLP
jgi:hypothetical protein